MRDGLFACPFEVLIDGLLAEELNTLFRGNSFCTAVLSLYQRRAGKQYLYATLRPLIKELLVYKHSLEVNPEQLKENEKLDENLVFLEVYVDKVMGIICKSAETYPPYAEAGTTVEHQILTCLYADL